MSEADRAFARIAARLLARARALAATRVLSRRADPRRWRHAGLLWPDFGKD